MQSTQTITSSSSSAGPSTTSAASSSSSGKPDRLYVGNLSPTVDEYTLIQIFSKYGKITKLDFMFHKTGVLKGKPRGFAFVQFANKDDALKAMVKLHDRLLRGRKLVVTYASSAPTDTLPLSTKGRRPNEAAKTTTLSLLKTSRKPQSAAAQIAAMEAKLANMARTKPSDETYIPGQSGSGSGSTSRLGTPGTIEGSPLPDDGMLGDEEAEQAARDLEMEMEVELARATGVTKTGAEGVAGNNDQVQSRGSEAEGISVSPETHATEQPKGADSPLPPKPSHGVAVTSQKGKGKGKVKERQQEQEQEQADSKRGLAGLPKKPAF
ncbi:single-stranded nucleic acid binding protein [Kwoniella heveanensis BCC8398]|uniref:Probable RNA-binding protein 18 n=1 Tax=Kwoniella heveanensis BCC8398 TaxID=1296120 RepID=A0A1B9H4A2_9TREE|nr:single-stranded nucleic acid binding protein [Kwoniella heveanensis BCC8398]